MKKILLPIIAVSSLYSVFCAGKEVAENGSPTETTVKTVLADRFDEVNRHLKKQNEPMSFKLNSAKLESCEDTHDVTKYKCEVNIDMTVKAGDQEKNNAITASLIFKKEADKWTVLGFL